MSNSQETIRCPACGAQCPASAPTEDKRVRCANCNTSFAPGENTAKRQRPKLVGKTLGNYAVLEQIARGGMGSVYKAKQLALGRIVALKRLSTRLEGGEFLQRFLTEAKAAAKLSHPNIVQVYDIGQEHGLHFIAMEFVEGQSLKTRIETKGALKPLEAVQIGIDVASALACARESNIIHRDIKPDNVLLSDQGHVKVADFGLAKLLDGPLGDDGHLTQEGLGMGTPHYMAPEQATNAKDADQRADTYSLGVTLYHMLTGRPPFEGASAIETLRQHEMDTAVPPCEYNPDIPASLCDVLSKMMAKKPEDRYQEPKEVVEALGEVAKEITQAQAATQGPEQA